MDLASLAHAFGPALLRGGRAEAFEALASRLGEAVHAARLVKHFLVVAGWRVGLGTLAGTLTQEGAQVFAALGPASDARARASRRQAGLAVLVYRHLLRHLPATVALDAMRPLITAGGLAYLSLALAELSPRMLATATPEVLAKHVRSWLGRFATATAEVVAVSPSQVVFDVHACALVRLCQVAGHPELAPLFCESDAAFFPHRGIHLARPSTLAGGGPHCRFILTPA